MRGSIAARKWARLALAIFGVLVLFLPGEAAAHGTRTAYLDIVEQRPGLAMVHLQLPNDSREVALRVSPLCKSTELAFESGAVRSQRRIDFSLACPTGLGGTAIGVDGLGIDVTAAVVRVRLAGGSESTHVLTKDRAEIVVPVGASESRVVASFFRLGVEHILRGADHLLFVLGLVWLARRGRRIVATVTAFTVAHSVSLIATALGWLHVAPEWAEACIALSLVLVALDVGRSDGDATHPAWSAGGFGVVHGLGFAGALAEIGLPKDATVTALFAFNLGVEAGQLAFVAACLGVALVARRWRGPEAPRLADRAQLVSAYVIGSLGVLLGLSRVHHLVRSVSLGG